MATESIMRSVVISDAKDAELFVNALEQAVLVAEKPLSYGVQSSDYTPEEMREAMDKILSNVRNQRK